MSKDLVLQLRYLGVIPQAGYREYGFSIEDKEKKKRQVVLTIDDAIFLRHQLMFQEAPDLCYQKVLKYLSDETGGLDLSGRLPVTDSDISSYRDSHPNGKGRTRPGARRER